MIYIIGHTTTYDFIKLKTVDVDFCNSNRENFVYQYGICNIQYHHH